MNLGRRNSILLLIAVTVTLLITIIGLPYSRFGWRTALAQNSYGDDIVPAQSAAGPAAQQDPQTSPAYTDSNGGLTNGQLFAPVIGAANVGNAGVIARGFIAAADFQVIGGDPFAPFPQPVRACVEGVGKPVFIPKVPDGTGFPSDLPVAPSDRPGETCVFIFQPGILVLVQN
ncbi:MAG: hypothetical protein ABI700_01770 [Chloroflexota bacterium]